MKVTIEVRGCDATTIVETELTASELKTLKKIAVLVDKASTYGCEPTIEIIEPNNTSQ